MNAVPKNHRERQHNKPKIRSTAIYSTLVHRISPDSSTDEPAPRPLNSTKRSTGKNNSHNSNTVQPIPRRSSAYRVRSNNRPDHDQKLPYKHASDLRHSRAYRTSRPGNTAGTGLKHCRSIHTAVNGSKFSEQFPWQLLPDAKSSSNRNSHGHSHTDSYGRNKPSVTHLVKTVFQNLRLAWNDFKVFSRLLVENCGKEGVH